MCLYLLDKNDGLKLHCGSSVKYLCQRISPWWLLKILFLVFQAYLMTSSNLLEFLWIYVTPCSIQHSVLKAKSLEEELEEAKNNLNLLEEKRQQIVYQNKQLVGVLFLTLCCTVYYTLL